MKKFLCILSFLGIFTALLFNSSKVFASEMDDFLSEYALVGEKLDEFERNERFQISQRGAKEKALDLATLQEQYEQYRSIGVFDEEITFDLYVQLATTPLPSDPVIPEFRSVAGNPQAGDILITKLHGNSSKLLHK
ncbi:hypothetical protein LI951_00075 [Enterococcus sp. BWT-B8]|uniref:hypothetical protein n=1 Tax=Enterococcus sp. BWT-B8 TaxID=2885157 RepID=UPI001E6374AB|nr:hypothetical protein [Enterococcus sp. BWT-B8]MCB5950455.1 hypothetical protein [Enterococcus sp. BWT-B8]